MEQLSKRNKKTLNCKRKKTPSNQNVIGSKFWKLIGGQTNQKHFFLSEKFLEE